MRLRFLFFLLLMIPVVLAAQSNKIFYNKGKMYVGSDYNWTTNNTIHPNTVSDATVAQKNTVLLVQGSVNFTTGSAVATKTGAAISITGDFESTVTGNDTGDANGHIFLPITPSNPLSGAHGAIFFNSKADGATLTIPIVGSDNGVKENATTTQTITLNTYNKQTIRMASKDLDKHYMVMPTIYSQHSKHDIAAGLNTAQVAAIKGGYLALDTTLAIATPRIYPSYNGVVVVNTAYSKDYSSTLVDGAAVGSGVRRLETAQIIGKISPIAYNEDGAATIADLEGYGTILHDIRLYDPTDVTAGGKSNLAPLNTGALHSDDYTVNLTGFTPLGQTWNADYMLFNVLTRPRYGSFTGWEGAITDPNYVMKAGYGYFMAMDAVANPVTSPYYAEVKRNWAVDRKDRAIGGYQIGGRGLKTTIPTGFFGKNNFDKVSKTLSPNASPYFSETTNNTESVKVELSKGFNFLGNPFTAPLDLTDIVAKADDTNQGGTVGGILPSIWGANISTSATDPTKDLRSTVFLVQGATLRYYKDNILGPRFEYRAGYWNMQAKGGTNQLDLGTGIFSVAPMQMFCLQASKDFTITLPYSKVNFSNVRAARAAEENVRKDELLIQALVLTDVDAESNDPNAILTEDRTCVMLVDNANMLNADPYDTAKMLTNVQESQNGEGSVSKYKLEGDDVENIEPYQGILYTKAQGGRDMITNVLPTTIERIEMYFAPTQKIAQIRLTPYRIDTWQEIKQAWLEDKLGDRDNNKSTFTKIEEGTIYNSESRPGDQLDRFVLHFNKIPQEYSPIESNVKPIACYYNTTNLYVSELNQDDIHSKLFVYDLQGRLMGQDVIGSAPTHVYPKALAQGTYIVKIVGKRNFTTKFVTLQN